MTTPCFCFEPLTLILTTFVKTMDRQGDDNNVASDQHKNSSFSPYYVQFFAATVSSLLDTIGIAWRASLFIQALRQNLRPYQNYEDS